MELFCGEPEKIRQEILAYGLSFPDTYQDAPFHDDNWQLVRYKGNRPSFSSPRASRSGMAK